VVDRKCRRKGITWKAMKSNERFSFLGFVSKIMLGNVVCLSFNWLSWLLYVCKIFPWH
jgi:hypothetical protein